MTDALKLFITWAFVGVIALIIFVRAGQYGGKSGGDQVATMANGIGGAFGGVIQSVGGQKL